MINRPTLISLAFSLAIIGGLSSTRLISPLPYLCITTIVFAIIGFGGLMNYNRQELQDIRDIYSERERLLKIKIETLKEEIINNEKEKIALEIAKSKKITSNNPISISVHRE